MANRPTPVAVQRPTILAELRLAGDVAMTTNLCTHCGIRPRMESFPLYTIEEHSDPQVTP